MLLVHINGTPPGFVLGGKEHELCHRTPHHCPQHKNLSSWFRIFELVISRGAISTHKFFLPESSAPHPTPCQLTFQQKIVQPIHIRHVGQRFIWTNWDYIAYFQEMCTISSWISTNQVCTFCSFSMSVSNFLKQTENQQSFQMDSLSPFWPTKFRIYMTNLKKWLEKYLLGCFYSYIDWNLR